MNALPAHPPYNQKEDFDNQLLAREFLEQLIDPFDRFVVFLPS
jgi:hypothetical protein